MVHLQQKSHALIAALLALGALCLASNASARQGLVGQWLKDGRSSIEMRAELGWGNLPRSGMWNPLRITLTSDTLVGGVLTIQYRGYGVDPYNMQTVYAITPDKESIIDLVIPIGEWHEACTVTLLNQQNRLVAKFDLEDMRIGNPIPPPSPEHTPLVAAPRSLAVTTQRPLVPGSTDAQSEFDYAVRHIEFDTTQLPTSHHAYDSLTVLVLDSQTMLEASQAAIEAIDLWVQQGGRVVLVLDKPGNAHERLVSREVFTAGEQHVDASGALTRSLQLADAAMHNGWAIQPGESVDPLRAVEGPVGFGWITVLGANPVRAGQLEKAFEQWDPLLAPMLRDVLHRQATADDQLWWSQITRGVGNMLNVVASMVEGVGSVSVWPVFLALLFLAAALGPIDWFLLKKIQRQHLSWLTACAWIVGLSTLAYIAGVALQTDESQLRTVSIVDMQQGEPLAQETRIDGIFSATSQRYKLQPFGQHARIRPVSRDSTFRDSVNMQTLPGARAVGVSSFRVPTMSYRSILTEHTIAPPAVSASVTQADPWRVAITGLAGDAHIQAAWLVVEKNKFVLKDWQFEEGQLVSSTSKPAPPLESREGSWLWEAQSVLQILSTDTPLLPGAESRSWSLARRTDRSDWALVGIVLSDFDTGNPVPAILDTKQTTILRILTKLDQPTGKTQ